MERMRYFFKCVIWDPIIDLLFPKDAGVAKLESLQSADLIALFKQSTEKLDPPPVDVISLFPYRDPNVKLVLHEIKYSANKALAAKIAPALYDAIQQLAATDNPNQRPIITFIPATQNRKQKRGFDQGKIIIDALHAYDAQTNSQLSHLCFDYNRNLLRWSRNVSQQSLTANKEERLSNMNNALESSEASLTGKTIVVLDDVCTTGATLADAKRALEAAGALKVHLLTIAH